jgi:hypothetical protein
VNSRGCFRRIMAGPAGMLLIELRPLRTSLLISRRSYHRSSSRKLKDGN